MIVIFCKKCMEQRVFGKLSWEEDIVNKEYLRHAY